MAGCPVLVLLLLACVTRWDLRVDLSEVAEVDPSARFVGRVVAFGETEADIDVNLAVSTTVDLPELLDARVAYGVVGFADLDGDGACSLSPVDLPFIGVLGVPARGERVVVWRPHPGDAAAMGEACGAFAPATSDTADDTDDTDDTDA